MLYPFSDETENHDVEDSLRPVSMSDPLDLTSQDTGDQTTTASNGPGDELAAAGLDAGAVCGMYVKYRCLVPGVGVGKDVNDVGHYIMWSPVLFGHTASLWVP